MCDALLIEQGRTIYLFGNLLPYKKVDNDNDKIYWQ